MDLNKYKLAKGDTIAIIAPSSGKAAEYPNVYREGIRNLEAVFGLNIVEYPTVKMNSRELHDNPEIRARDVNNAFADPAIKAIITTIGGDDSVRILPFLDRNIIENNPKIFMGYSDATVLLAFLNQLGVVAFHGPSVMAGLAQTGNLPKEYEEHVNKMLFENFDRLEYRPYSSYCNGYPDWADSATGGKIAGLESNSGWNWINGEKSARGSLFGGCIEALEFIKSTDYWPDGTFWQGKVLFLETSEEKPGIDNVKYMLRNYGVQGIFQKISALFFGRAIFYSEEEKKDLEKMIINVVVDEFKAKELPIITNMDFGHTDPQFILPLGAGVEIDPGKKTITLVNAMA